MCRVAAVSLQPAPSRAVSQEPLKHFGLEAALNSPLPPVSPSHTDTRFAIFSVLFLLSFF